MIVLYESELKTRLVPVGTIVHLRKKPPGVAVLLRSYDLDRWDSSLFYLHHGPPSLPPDRPRRRSSARSGGSRPPRIGAMCGREAPRSRIDIFLTKRLARDTFFQNE